MLLLNSLRKMVSRATAHRRGPRRVPGHRPGNRRLEIEALEERALLSIVFRTIDVPGATSTSALGISASSEVVGRYTADGITHGFLLSRGSYTTLDVPGATSTEAWANNASGQIVGTYTAGDITHGFLRSDDIYTTLDPPGATFTMPRGINDAGQIVGGYTDAGGTSHGFLLSGGVFSTLDVPGAAFTSYASGINDLGQIVGRYDTATSNFGFLLSGGSYTTLDVPGSVSSAALGINNFGLITGGYTAGGTRHGYLLSGGSYTLFDVAGSTLTTPFKITDTGLIAGFYVAGGANHGFLATAECTGSWSPAADMAEPRAFYSATLLEDGRVLVAGGFTRTNGIGPPLGGHYTAGAQIYDPRSDSWETTGNLVTSRAGHGEVRLADGRVLVAGGQTGVPPVSLDSAEIYDPATGAWTATGSMHVRRNEPELTLLPDGRVFVSGATRVAGPDAKSAEIYDPATGQWARVADMSTSRNDHIQVLLNDGRVLVAGGFRDTVAAPGEYFASAEIYDPRTDAWTPTGSMNLPRADGEPVVLPDGRVLIMGGNIALGPTIRTATAEIYDPATGVWTLTRGALSDPKVDFAYTLLPDGRVLAAGGVRSMDNPVTSADIYDPMSDTWTPAPNLARARYGILAVTLADGRVLVVGGLNHDPETPPEQALASAELFRATPPARVESVRINDGSAQRSRVTSLTVTFDRVVTLDSGAFELRRQDGSLVSLSVATSVADGRTVAALTFTGADVIGGSLADGNYTLTVRGDAVHDRFGRPLDGDGDGTPGGDRSDAFFRLYGDSDGDRDVDLIDLGRFLSTLGRRRGDPHFLGYMDFNGDDRVGLIDLFAFAERLGTHLNP